MCAVVEKKPYFPEGSVACLLSSATLGKSSSSLWQGKGGSNKCLKHVFNAGYPTWATGIKLDFGFSTPLVPLIQIQYDKGLSSHLFSLPLALGYTQQVRRPRRYYCIAPCEWDRGRQIKFLRGTFLRRGTEMTARYSKEYPPTVEIHDIA